MDLTQGRAPGTVEEPLDFEAHHYFDDRWSVSTFHSHPFFEIYFFISGSVRIMIEDRRYAVQPYDMLIFPPGSMHRNLPVNNANYERAYIYVSQGYLRSFSQPGCDLAEIYAHTARAGRSCYHLGRETAGVLVGRIDRIISLQDGGNAQTGLVRQCQITSLLAEIGGILCDGPAGGAMEDDTRAAEVLRYINQHFREPLLLDALARRFFTSKYHLLREFKQCTGTTIHRYQVERRIACAQTLMHRGSSPAQAASACGFSDYTSFYRAFKRMTGCSPLAYVEEHGPR